MTMGVPSGRTLSTIGVYGWTDDTFHAALERAGVDLIVDIRARRGVRGAAYAFANRARLEARLRRLGIGYAYLPELAPTPEIRAEQRAADAADGMAKRDRSRLSTEFIARYQDDVLGALDLLAINASVVPLGAHPCLLCVEGPPEACHRSIAAAALADIGLMSVSHLRP